MSELPVIEKTYDFIKWYVPILNCLPRHHKFMLGDRAITKLYDLLEGLIEARYASEKLKKLEQLNSKLDILRYQTRLLLDFKLISFERYKYAVKSQIPIAYNTRFLPVIFFRDLSRIPQSFENY